MARTVSYGMGQYRFTKNYNYITSLLEATGSDNSGNISYYKKDVNETHYKDILIKLPTVSTNNTPIVQYGQTYFLKLSVPQNRQYNVTLNLKLCPADSDNNPILTRFQQIARLEIPPTPDEDDVYSEVLLHEIPEGISNAGSIAVSLIDADHDKDVTSGFKQNEVYKREVNKTIEYHYYIDSDNWVKIKNFNAAKLIRSWEVADGTESVITYKIAFSPKYNLTEGYRYLFIETDRDNLWSNEIQHVDEVGDLYNGTYLTKESISVSLYSVNNLLAGGSAGTSQIKSGTNTLNHIAVWGHPEQIITINGEEIKIGQSGFYEIKDYDITSLGMVVENPETDRFTIDYEYKVTR